MNKAISFREKILIFVGEFKEFKYPSGKVRIEKLREAVFKNIPGSSTVGDWVNGKCIPNSKKRQKLFERMMNDYKAQNSSSLDLEKKEGNPANEKNSPKNEILIRALHARDNALSLTRELKFFINLSPDDRHMLVSEILGDDFDLLLDLMRAHSSEEARRKVLEERPELAKI